MEIVGQNMGDSGCSLMGRCILVPRIYEGDAPKGQGESEYTKTMVLRHILPPASLRFGHPLINEWGKGTCGTAAQTAKRPPLFRKRFDKHTLLL